MDYEKKYKEALERVRRLHDRMLVLSSTDALVASAELEFIFPELTESEDEKIRKGLVKLLTVAGEAYVVKSTGIKKDSYLAWLEKQKETENVSASTMIPSCWAEEPSDDELQRYQDELYDFKVFATKQAKEHHISFVHDFEWNNFCAGLLSYFNEQKPAEWDELQAEFRSINEAFEDGKKEVIEHPEKYGLQKPAEWNANDKAFIKDCAHILDENGYAASAERLLSMFEQKPVSISCGHENDAEWSDEDADMLNCCISSVEEAKENRYAYNETDGNTSYDREIDWLKSLRPQYHGDVTMTEAYKMGLEAGKASSWKPSEEQMKALEAATVRYQSTGLESLYEDLKKL